MSAPDPRGPAVANRRPLASRETRWARALSASLAARGLSPNAISAFSVVAAAAGGGAFWASGGAEGAARVLLLLTAAAACQVRLLCNLMDGLVAVEAGRQTPDGPFWNEVPDRAADILILVGAGLAAGAPALGWAAAAMAVLTAYVREFGRASGLPADYRGPMAKPHRMAAVTLAALLAVLEPLWGGEGLVLWLALWAVALGSAVTALRRGAGILEGLRARGG